MKKTIQVIFVIIPILTFNNIYSQNNLLYYMDNVPQAYYVNPATQPACNFYIGGSQYEVLMNSAVSLSDLFWYDATLDSVVHPLRSSANLQEFLNKFDENEQIKLDAGINILSFGFRANYMYFSFDASIKTSNHISYPTDLVKFLLMGNTNNTTYNFSGMSFESLNYMEFAFNISRSFGDMLTLGVRPKILYGLGSVVTQDNNFTLETSTEEWILTAQSNIRMAVTGQQLPVDENGLLDPFGDFNLYNPLDSVSKTISSLNKNRGFGIDFGAHLRPIDKLELSVSLLDLGYIKWADKPQSIVLDGTYHYQGINFNTPDSLSMLDPILDSLKENLSLTGTGDPFRTALYPKLIAGGRIFLTQRIDVGLLSRTEFYPEEVDQDFILLANFRPLRGFSFSASYSMLGEGHSSIGLGWAVKLGPVSSFFMSEYNPFRYDLVTQSGKFRGIIPVDTYGLSIRAGANFVIGCNKAKKLRRDKPMFNSTDWMY